MTRPDMFARYRRFTRCSPVSRDGEDGFELLGGLFAEFDALAARLGPGKIKTPGDGYRVAAGCPCRNSPLTMPPRCQDGTAMREAASTAARGSAERLQLRMGCIERARLIAGVLGTL